MWLQCCGCLQVNNAHYITYCIFLSRLRLNVFPGNSCEVDIKTKKQSVLLKYGLQLCWMVEFKENFWNAWFSTIQIKWILMWGKYHNVLTTFDAYEVCLHHLNCGNSDRQVNANRSTLYEQSTCDLQGPGTYYQDHSTAKL